MISETSGQVELVPPVNGNGVTAPSVVRELERALDSYAQRGMWSAFGRLAETITPLAAQHPGLTERIARFRLMRENAPGALQLIDSLNGHRGGLTSSLVLLRAVALLLCERPVEAHDMLHHEAHPEFAGVGANEILACLSWDLLGEPVADVSDRAKRLNSMRAQMLNIAGAIGIGHQFENALREAEALASMTLSGIGMTELDIFCMTCGVNMQSKDLASVIQRLGAELVEAEHVIPILGEAHADSPDASLTRILAEAIQSRIDEVEDSASAAVASARMFMALGDCINAWKVVERGLELNPLSAPLALLRQSIQTTHGSGAMGEEEAA